MSPVLVGRIVMDRDGAKVGKLVDLISDPHTLEPQWATVKMGMVAGKRLVPIGALQDEGEAIRLPYTKDQVKDAPQVEPGAPTEDEQRQLNAYYGMSPSGAKSSERSR